MSWGIWLGYLAFLALLVAIDVGLFQRRPRRVTQGEAFASTMLWAMTAAGVGLLVAYAYRYHWAGLGETRGAPLSGHQAWLQFLTAYCVEFALSLDNVAIFALLFAYLGVSPAGRHRALFWTTIAALVARAALIALGFWALRWHATQYLFGVLLMGAVVRTLLMPDERTDFDRRLLIRVARRLSERFSRAMPGSGRSRHVPLAVVVLVAAAADLSFNADSVPGVFAITHDPFIALSASTLAILALRSLYFALADVIRGFRFLKVSLTLLLLGLTVKTLLNWRTDPATLGTLGFAWLVVGAGVVASIARRRARPAESARARPAPIEDVAEAVAVTRRSLRKVIILIVGTAIVVTAVLIAPLPGPGFIILAPLGLAVLATEFIWAKRLLDRLKAQTSKLQRHAESLAERTNPWWVPVVTLVYGAAIVLLLRATDVPRKFIISGAVALLFPLAYWAWRTLAAARRAASAERNARGDSLVGPASSPPSAPRATPPSPTDTSLASDTST